MTGIEPLLCCKEIMGLTGIKSRSTIWRRVKDKSFPAPIRIGENSLRWRGTDIRDWLESRPVELY
jgi:prophage regulatory protein